LLGRLGLPVPAQIALAEAGGIDEGSAFDDDAIAAALLTWPDRVAPEERPASAAIGGPSGTGGGHGEGTFVVPEGRGATIEVEDLVHRYPGGVEAVRDAYLRVGPGEVVAIVGQNGSGKTTLIKHLNGLLRPTSGRVLVDGHDATSASVSALARSVGFVFQDPDDQLFQRSVEREVAFGPRNLGLDRHAVEERVTWAVGLTGIAHERATNPYDLGPSLRKLVALASVLAMEPEVLVMDEPTAGQDGPGVERIGSIVERWAAAGRAVIAITHDMEFAARHFRRIVVMRQGSIVSDGPPSTVLAASNGPLLASTGLVAPPCSRIAAKLGLEEAPADARALLMALGRRHVASD
jgi:energy-coupling factor transport system ATP-binding protein